MSESYTKLTPYACQEISRQLDNLHGQVDAYDADSNTLAVSRNGEEIPLVTLASAFILLKSSYPVGMFWRIVSFLIKTHYLTLIVSATAISLVSQ